MKLIHAGLALTFCPIVYGHAPAWIDRPPKPDSNYLYVVGAGQATTRNEAEKGALADALGQLAANVSVTVAAKTIDTESSQDDSPNVFAETKTSARGLIREAIPVGEPWVTISRSGLWPFWRRETFSAKVLLKWPRTALERERHRQTSAWRQYRSDIDRLAHEVVVSIKRTGLTGVAVGGFHEITTARTYSFSQVIKRDLADALVRAGAFIVEEKKAQVSVGGAYRLAGNEVVITARVVRVKTGECVGVADGAIDRALIEPAWLEDAHPNEFFFEGLEPEHLGTKMVGAISVTSIPEGAQIFVDGVARGWTPSAFGGIPIGTRSLKLVDEEYEPFNIDVPVMHGETTPIEATLVPKIRDFSIPGSGSTRDWGDFAAGASAFLIPGLPALLWNDRDEVFGWGTISCLAVMGVEASALARGQYAVAGELHGATLIFGLIGFEIKDQNQKVSVTGGQEVAVAWSRRF